MIYNLEDIKSKRLDEKKQAILSDGFCILDFGDTLIYKKDPSIKYKLATISHKDLFTYQYDNANSIDSYSIPFDMEFDKLKYEEIIINANDSTFFSSISAAGEDLFFQGLITWIQSCCTIEASGLIYFSRYYNHKLEAIKKIDVKSNEINEHYIDYHVFYYLFQMFKNLSGKKTNTLLIAKDKGTLYLTNQNRDYYIISLTPSEYKKKNFDIINRFYTEKKFNKLNQIIRKDFIQDKDSFVKHLSRPLGDICDMSEDQLVYKLSGNAYSLWINKLKN